MIQHIGQTQIRPRALSHAHAVDIETQGLLGGIQDDTEVYFLQRNRYAMLDLNRSFIRLGGLRMTESLLDTKPAFQGFYWGSKLKLFIFLYF